MSARAEAFLRLRCLETEGAIGAAQARGRGRPVPRSSRGAGVRGEPRTPAPGAGEGGAGAALRAASRPRGARRGGAGEEAGAAWSFWGAQLRRGLGHWAPGRSEAAAHMG